MGWTSEVMAGLAQLLDDNSVGVYNPTGAYTAGQVGIVLDVVPADPERVITLTAYGDEDDPTQDESTLLVQLRTRGTQDPRTCSDLQDAAFDVLQNLPSRQVGGYRAAACFRTSTAYLGVDQSGRHQRVSNWRLTVHRPTPNRH